MDRILAHTFALLFLICFALYWGLFVHHNSAIMNTDACISSRPYVMVVRPRLILPKLGMVGLILQGPQLDGQVMLSNWRWCHKSRECVKLCALKSAWFCNKRGGGASIWLFKKWWEDHICNRIITQLFQRCLWFGSPWMPVLDKVLVCNTFGTDTTVVLSSADSWWPSLSTGHIYRDMTVSHSLNW
jgi:hypothetical protein